MSSNEQTKKSDSAKNGTSVTPILLIILFVSVIGAVIFFLREKIMNFASKRSESQNDTQSGSPLSPQTETIPDDAKPEEKTSDEKASESAVIENFVAPEEIPDDAKMVR